ncbi:hypothetical protein BH24PSE1_BH24PSE1_03660 [soil metagenome]
MRVFLYSAAAALLASTGAATATAKPSKGAHPRLSQAMNSMVLDATGHNDGQPPGQSNRPADPDMGDDNAAQEAILTVCFKNTPAAQRSAICDREPVSPN